MIDMPDTINDHQRLRNLVPVEAPINAKLRAEALINAKSRAEAPIDTASRAEAQSSRKVDLRLDLKFFALG